MDGKAHFIAGITFSVVICVILWLIQWNFSLISLGFAVFFGGLFALFPDLDLKLHAGHRNILFHSAVLPGIITAIVVWGLWGDVSSIFAHNFIVAFSMYFSIAFGSHLLLDFPQSDVVKLTVHGGRAWLFCNGILCLVLGFLAGWCLLL